MHVEDEYLVAQRVSYVYPLRSRVDGNSSGPFEISLAALQAADGAQELSARLKDKNHARIGIGDIDIVLGIDSDALRHQHIVLVFSAALDELVLVLGEVEDVHAQQRPDQ